MKPFRMPVTVSVFGTLVLVWVLLVPPAFSQPLVNDHAVELGGGFFHQGRAGALNLDASYGYYLNSSWEAGLRQAFNVTFMDTPPDIWAATTAPFVKYNYHFFHNLVVFGGAFLGAVWNERNATAALGPQVGLKYFLNGQVYFTPSYRYDWFVTPIETGAARRVRAHHAINLGIGFVWGGSGKAERMP